MYFLRLLASLAAFGFGAADSPQGAPGACFTPQNTMCRTLRWDGSGWENTSWGFHAVRRWRGSTILSYRRDGAIMERNSRREWRNYFILTSHWDTVQIKFPLEHRSIRIDNKTREYYERPVVPGGSPVWDAQDTDCAKLALAFDLSDLRRVTGETVIAGIPSIEYTGKRSKTERYSVWLAPSLGCTQMRVVTNDHSSFGLPTSHSQFEVVSARLGEPETGLFQVPTGYRRVLGGW
jgi:hypothetical protein